MTIYKTCRHIQVKSLRASGLRNSEVAAQLGIKPCSASAMYRYQPTGNRKGKPVGDNRARAIAMMEQGDSFTAIGAALGMTRQGAHALCHYRASDEFRGRVNAESDSAANTTEPSYGRSTQTSGHTIHTDAGI